ncbi:hypothetical protein CBOM_01067 [Ceraceosorus bombacis]|uniref:Uncharacterized protein n=1 Tax=Ceraceosorus bombacis TaxID=401625 RepID=A0A0P1BCT6_9BASI|nr:hypothetical protein CBOM_01067 [Ceraceosorus bombacis]
MPSVTPPRTRQAHVGSAHLARQASVLAPSPLRQVTHSLTSDEHFVTARDDNEDESLSSDYSIEWDTTSPSDRRDHDTGVQGHSFFGMSTDHPDFPLAQARRYAKEQGARATSANSANNSEPLSAGPRSSTPLRTHRPRSAGRSVDQSSRSDRSWLGLSSDHPDFPGNSVRMSFIRPHQATDQAVVSAEINDDIIRRQAAEIEALKTEKATAALASSRRIERLEEQLAELARGHQRMREVRNWHNAQVLADVISEAEKTKDEAVRQAVAQALARRDQQHADAFAEMQTLHAIEIQRLRDERSERPPSYQQATGSVDNRDSRYSRVSQSAHLDGPHRTAADDDE